MELKHINKQIKAFLPFIEKNLEDNLGAVYKKLQDFNDFQLQVKRQYTKMFELIQDTLAVELEKVSHVAK